MTFTSDTLLNLTSGNSVTITSGNIISFTTLPNMTIQFMPMGNPVVQPCFVGQLLGPPPPYLQPCTWWEIFDPQGNPTGFEFHVDEVTSGWFHVDAVFPGPFPLPPALTTAQLKINAIEPCDYFYVEEPPEWGPPVCSWWEVVMPQEWAGIEFHVDWSNESCEFHVDQVVGVTPILVPWPYEVVAEQKIPAIAPCTKLFVSDLVQSPQPCTWWEIVYPKAYYGYEFHVDQNYQNGTFHIDQVTPGPIVFPVPPPYQIIAEQKITQLTPCTTLKIRANPSGSLPVQCDWYEIIYPTVLRGYEFHIDWSDGSTLHVDQVMPQPMPGFVTYEIVAERKIRTINPCDTFKVFRPTSWHPDICSWWQIVDPPEWAGTKFHIDNWNGVNNFYWFHIDSIDPLPPGPAIPSWKVTAEPFTPPDPWYYKAPYRDYAQSGVPDFDERQWGTYNWTDLWGKWSHCAPVAVANSLWWLDSEFEPNVVPPPTISDGFPLVRAYGAWDDHASRNVVPLVEHLAYLMDCDGRRTGLLHSGTYVVDSETGITHYLSWSGVNPLGDVNGDGTVDQTDLMLVNNAMGSVPGAPNWNMAADIFPVTMMYPPVADNIVDPQDLNLVVANMGRSGLFYEHTTLVPTFKYIVEEVEKCQDVVLSIGYWIWTGSTWYREDGHFVTVAGVNSQDVKIAICDPIRDSFETGLIPEGRIPIPHVHMPPEPPFITHNDASYVSQDIYNVTGIPPMLPPCPGGNLILANFPTPGLFAVIEAAVVTSPSGIHDVAVTNVKTSKDGCKPMPTVPDTSFVKVNVTVMNKGNFTETFNVILNANSTVVDTKTVTALASGTQTTIYYTWNTTGWAHGNYSISAYAVPVAGEVNTADNTFVNGVIKVVIPGDINGDGFVDIYDAILLAGSYNAVPGRPNWNPNADLKADDVIDIYDAIILANHYNQHE